MIECTIMSHSDAIIRIRCCLIAGACLLLAGEHQAARADGASSPDKSSPIQSISIYPASIRLDARGDCQQCVLIGVGPDGQTHDLTTVAKWSVAPPDVAVIDANHRLT